MPETFNKKMDERVLILRYMTAPVLKREIGFLQYVLKSATGFFYDYVGI
jgi:hypothetical protein